MTKLPLLERQAELGALERAAREVLAGEGRVMLVEGGPGAGKSRLLSQARVLAADAGLRVLSGNGGELEREFPYGVVRQLFEAALLDPDAAAWLEGPAASSSSVFAPQSTESTVAFATLNGLYWLAVNAAARAPLALVVDDLHWVDSPSVHFLRFLARRLEGLPVLLVIGGRPAETDVLADLAAGPGASTLRPAPLSKAAAAKLTHDVLGVRPAARFAGACWEATGGNPLLTIELLRALRAERVVPDVAHVSSIEHVGPAALAGLVLVRLRGLPPAALAVAQAIAILGSGAAAPLVGELAGVDEEVVARVVESLVSVEIIDAQPPLGFVHPIVRDAIYRELAPDERDRRHARAAELLYARAADPARVGAHLMLSQPRGELWASRALRAAAHDAAHRGAEESALTFLRRAVAERPGDADADLLFSLGMAEAAIDPDAAVGHLRAARAATADPGERGRVAELITRMLVFTDPPAAVACAREARAELGDDAGELRDALLALERYAGRFHGAPVPRAPDPEPNSTGSRMLMAVEAWDRALSGGAAGECVALAAGALGLDEPAEGRIPLFTAIVASTVLGLADDQRAQGFWDEWHAEAVRSGRAHAVIAGSVWRGWIRLRLGFVADAEAALREALEGPRRWGPGTESVSAATLSMFAGALIDRGDLAGAQAALNRALERENPQTEGAVLCRSTQLRLLLAQGRADEVLHVADAVGERLRTVVNPAWGPWRSVRAEALARLGRTEEAIVATAEELELARRWGTPGPIGRALSVLGELEGRIDLLEEAVETTRDPFARLEHIRALLALGGAVRRRRRPTEARAHLRDAHDLATRCGALALARRARDELAAAGGRPRAVLGTGAASLTPSERRVAELAAAGRRNREIARQLYLSPKTVEVHLSTSYRKLGIRGRGELAVALGGS